MWWDITYIWFDANHQFRSKVRRENLESIVLNLSEVPIWNYDGSSTGQADINNSEITLTPYKVYQSQPEMIAWVLCSMSRFDSELDSDTVLPESIYDSLTSEIINGINTSGMKLGFEQEFYIFDSDTRYAVDYSTKPLLHNVGTYYCSVGNSGNGFIEKYIKLIYERACELGVHCSGWNTEVAPAQGEIQVCTGAITACHDLIFLRYLMWIILAEYNLYPVFHPKPLGPMWSGSGLHTNVSTTDTMNDGGYDIITQIMDRLTSKHAEHIDVYGKDNHLRLTGGHETSTINTFNWKVASRAVSVRIPTSTYKNRKGYFEDRRPGANANPYEICLRMWATINGS